MIAAVVSLGTAAEFFYDVLHGNVQERPLLPLWVKELIFMIITHKVDMDLQEPGQLSRVYAVQDDRYCRNLELTLYSGLVPWTVPEGAQAVVRYRKSDGTGGEYNVLPDGSSAWAAESNVLTVALAPQVLTVPGTVMLSVALLKGDAQLTSFGVCVVVKPAVREDIAESEDYVNLMVVGSVEALPYGSEPTAALADVGDSLVLNLGIPQGRTPEKGKDYWTEEDRQGLLDELQQLYGDEKVITIEASSGGFWDSSDVWVEAAEVSAKRTNLIPVVHGDSFSYVGDGASRIASVIWFDIALNVLTFEQYSVPKGVRKIPAPAGAAYGRFYSHAYTSEPSEVVLEVGYLPKSGEREIEIQGKLNGYWSTSGDWVAADGFASKRTNPIPVLAGDTFYYTGRGIWATVSVLWYQEDGTILSAQQYAAEDSGPVSVTLTPPGGAVFVRFASFNDGPALENVILAVSFETEDNLLKWLQGSNCLWGKKYVACGDSFTAGSFAEQTEENWDEAMQVYKTYAWWIADRNRMKLVNEAVSGSTMHNNGSEDAFCVTRYQQIPEDADYITLCFGLNETDAAIGTLEDTTGDTVLGAWNVVLEGLITNHPYAKIGILIPDGWCSEAMRDAIASAATYWGIPYLDLKGDTRVPMMIGGRYSDSAVSEKAVTLRNTAFQMSDTDAHPNVKGHEYRSTVIEHFLRSL